MRRFFRSCEPWGAACLLVVAAAGCESSDTIAPDGATITLNANPTTIVLVGNIQSAPATIIATVSSSIGVPLPGQDVRFSTTAGVLDPPQGEPVTTDVNGNATTILTEARQGPTITARSGKAMSQPLQLQTATCNLSAISLSPGPLTLDNCSQTFALTAVATDTNGARCPGVLIRFDFVPTNTPSTDVSGSFNPVQAAADPLGEVDTTLTISNSDCTMKCVAATCTGQIEASSGTVKSTPPVQINDNVS